MRRLVADGSVAAGEAQDVRHEIASWSVGSIAVIACVLVASLGLALRTYWLVTPELVNVGEPDAYISDEGVVGLMGKHILEGRETPIFFYGQYYLGALEAYLVALSESVLGVRIVAVRVVPYLFSLGVVAVVWVTARLFVGPVGALVAVALASAPPAYVLAWGLKARGGFVEHMFLSTLLLALLWFVQLKGPRRGAVLGLGFTAGLGLWVNQLVGVFLTVFCMVVWRRRLLTSRQLLLAALAFVIGALPLVVSVVRYPSRMPNKLARKFVLLNRVSPQERESEQALLYAAAGRITALADGPKKLAVVFGLPETQAQVGSGVWLALGLAPLLLFGGGLMHCLWRARSFGWSGPDGVLVALFCGVLAVGYISSRYMLVAYPLAILMASAWVARIDRGKRAALSALVAATIIFNIVSVAHWAQAAEPDKSNRLITELLSLGCTSGYSAGPMYHIVFRSKERIILAPLQKNRYPAYDEVVKAASRPCYLYRADQASKRQHLRLVELLRSHGVRYLTHKVGSYTVMYDFSPRSKIGEALVREARAG